MHAGMVACAVSQALASPDAADRPLPPGAVVELVGRATPPAEAWGTILVSLIDSTTVAMIDGWEEARSAGGSLAEPDAAWIHLASKEPGDWIHGWRWRDPVAVGDRLQARGARPLGGGRFDLDSGRLIATLVDDWLLIRPSRSSWRPPLRALLQAASAESEPRDGDIVLQARIAHDAPIDGTTDLSIRPTGGRAAEVRVSGRYASNPLGSSSPMPLDPQLLDALDASFAATVLESGIGILDPRIVEASIDLPDLIPPPALRRHLQSRRVLVLDSMRIDEGIDVPTLGLAIPIQDVPARPEALVEMVDEWMGRVARVLWSRWNPGVPMDPPVAMAGGGGHRPLGPGFVAAMDRHPLALGSSLNWRVRLDAAPDRTGWLILGTSASVVEALDSALSPGPSVAATVPAAAAGTTRPSRLAEQVRSLAGVRRLGGDPASDRDVRLLERLAGALDRLDRIHGVVHTRTPTELEMTLQVQRRSQETSGRDGR